MTRRPHRERGTAAIEMTVVFFGSLVLLAVIVLFGRLTWHATALTKSVANTSRIVTTLPRLAIVNAGTVRAIVNREIPAATVSAGLDLPALPDNTNFQCGLNVCIDTLFDTITVTASILFHDTVFDADLLPSDYDDPILNGIAINSTFERTYVSPKIPASN